MPHTGLFLFPKSRIRIGHRLPPAMFLTAFFGDGKSTLTTVMATTDQIINTSGVWIIQIIVCRIIHSKQHPENKINSCKSLLKQHLVYKPTENMLTLV